MEENNKSVEICRIALKMSISSRDEEKKLMQDYKKVGIKSIWLDLILRKELGVVVDWSRVDKEDYLLAMERSPVRDIEIKHLLKRALTDNINDRALWMRSIDHSYRYEGYSAFRAEDLHIEGKKIEQSPFHSQSR